MPAISVAPLGQERVGAFHRVDHDTRQLGQERLRPAQQPPMPHRPAQDATHHVAAALICWPHTISGEEGQRADVVGDDLVAEALRLERLRVVAEQVAHPLVDRLEDVDVVVGRHALQDGAKPLEAHPGVDALERQRHARAVSRLVELHEHEVPDLEPARARFGVVGHAVRPLAELGAAIEVDLAARPARSGVGHAPEVVIVALVGIAPARHALLGHAHLAPQVPGLVVVRVGRRAEPLEGDLVFLGQQLDRPRDRLALEVVAEAPVAEHLEEGVVARSAADLLEVVVLAGHAQAALNVDGALVGARLGAGEHVLELDHARVGEEQRLVARGHQRGAGHDGMSSLGEEIEEALSDLRGRHRRDRRAVLTDGAVGHGLRVAKGRPFLGRRSAHRAGLSPVEQWLAIGSRT